LQYRISRNAAVLLGEKREDSKEIFSQVNKLYEKRSKIVHFGTRRVIEKEDLLKLRNYVRESIKEIYHIDKDKNEVMVLLNTCGFGERIKRHE